jgi:hypothetical protein
MVSLMMRAEPLHPRLAEKQEQEHREREQQREQSQARTSGLFFASCSRSEILTCGAPCRLPTWVLFARLVSGVIRYELVTICSGQEYLFNRKSFGSTNARLRKVKNQQFMGTYSMPRMETYDDLVKFARLCLGLARKAVDKNTAQDFLNLAEEYRAKAAKLNGGKLPFIEHESE